jgi:hypothetical protein
MEIGMAIDLALRHGGRKPRQEGFTVTIHQGRKS